MASGLTTADEIIAEACAITGDHIEGVMDTLLMEGENIHWLKCAGGKLAAIDQDSE